MDLGLNGRRALLLASSGGLGYASALALAQEGVQVCISGSDTARAEGAALKITDQTGQAAFGLPGDLSDPVNMDTLVDAAQAALGGPIDILFANHGGPPLRTALDVSQEELAAQVNPMILSQVRAIQRVVPGMQERKWGRILMVGAAAVAEPVATNVLSSMYRTAMAHYFKTLSHQVVRDGVTVNIVSPTAVLTERTRSTAATLGAKKGLTQEQELARREENTPAGRLGTPEEFGATVAYLCSNNAGYLTGGNIRVDGGDSAGL
ncbi:MAG: 3-oxoacyl-[acyl-carrier protein] reductase [Paracoccaceae bacterium]|jgi:3-oxoacyl-[acyl-carrier protein] reductase